MRKLSGYLLLLIALVSSCRKDNDHVFSESVDQRLSKKLSAYQEQLSGAPYGWKMIIAPAGGGAYGFYMKFNDANRVDMVSDFDSASAVTLKESSYRLKAMQQPSIIFDTYSYLHVLADPDGSVNGGKDGVGLESDFEFFFNDSTTADTIKLTGRVNGSKAILVKASREEADVYTSGTFNVNLFHNILRKILQYFKQLTVSGKSYDLNINPGTRTIIITSVDDQGNPNSFTTSFYFSLNGIEFSQPFLAGSTIVTGFYGPVWSGAAQTITADVGNNTSATIKGVAKPQVLDTEAPRRWWQQAVDDGGYWESYWGFHKNGVDDAFGINSVESYYSLIYWPGYDPGIDLLAPTFINNAGTGLELRYGAGLGTPTFTTGGKAIFDLKGFYGAYPDSGPVYETLVQLMIPQGYYFVQTGETSFDMVSADDAKTWLTWYH